jgi:hypothetical protein
MGTDLIRSAPPNASGCDELAKKQKIRDSQFCRCSILLNLEQKKSELSQRKFRMKD